MMMHDFIWHNSSWVWVLIIGLLVAFSCAMYWFFRVRVVASMLSSKRSVKKVLINFSFRTLYLKIFLIITALVFLFLTLLRPQLRGKDETIKQQGRDLVIALDISRSMLAEDVAPSRLAAAKKKIEALVASLSCERVGLMLFSGTALMQCPLTTDHAAFLMFLRDVDAETISSGTTAMDQAIDRAIHVYASMENRKHKMLVLFTDGEDFSSSLVRIRERAKEAGLTIFTVGVGTSEGAPVPLFDEEGKRSGYMKDTRGAVVVSRRNDAILDALAREAGGVYIPMAVDDKDIVALVDHVVQREKEMLGEKTLVHIEELYPYGAALSCVLLLLEWIL